jgi:hypothetical protein
MSGKETNQPIDSLIIVNIKPLITRSSKVTPKDFIVENVVQGNTDVIIISHRKFGYGTVVDPFG